MKIYITGLPSGTRWSILSACFSHGPAHPHPAEEGTEGVCGLKRPIAGLRVMVRQAEKSQTARSTAARSR